jgi:Fe-S cluster assembly iron-binding protein IscA
VTRLEEAVVPVLRPLGACTLFQGDTVLEITHGAAELLTEIRREQDVPDTYGLRVFPESTDPGEVTIGLGFTDEPAAGDVITQQDGMLVFVARELAAPLGEAAIDVTQEDGEQRLVFRPKDESPVRANGREPMGGPLS